jgi:hypothetical protein
MCIPVLTSAAYVLSSNLYYRPLLPPTMAVHFDLAGRPNGYLSWSANLALMLGILLIFLLLSFLIGQIWLQRRMRGKFNPFVLISGGIAAIIAWANYCLIEFNLSNGGVFEWHFNVGIPTFAGALLYSLAIELGRMPQEQESGAQEPDDRNGMAPRSDIHLKSARHFYVEQRSNPWWWNPLLVVSAAISIGVFVLGWIVVPPGSAGDFARMAILYFALPLELLIMLPVVVCFFGGYRYVARREGVTVRLGLIGIPLKRIPLSALTGVSVIRDFSPLTEFMGYGWRINPKSRLTGYCLCSGDAVKLETGNWSYILVMDSADEFADIVKQAWENH